MLLKKRAYAYGLFCIVFLTTLLSSSCGDRDGAPDGGVNCKIIDSGASPTDPMDPYPYPFPTSTSSSVIPGPIRPDPIVETLHYSTIGVNTCSLNARVHPKGRPANVYFEYGLTSTYGKNTVIKQLGPKLSAYYKESWNHGTGGFSGGMYEKDLTHQVSGGILSSGFVRYTDPGSTGNDTNHYDGIGTVHLAQYLYSGSYRPEGKDPHAALGGGDFDIRGAEISLYLRGVNWEPRNTDLSLWIQNDIDLAMQNDQNPKRANWSLSGTTLTDHLYSGNWSYATYKVINDTRLWSYAGNYGGREAYAYHPLDDSLRHANTNMFHQIIYVNLYDQPSGSIDFDELNIVYRNHNVLVESNGGKVLSYPLGTNVDKLTDGWRNGINKEWETNINPNSPQEIVYELNDIVNIDTIQVHQNPRWPTKNFEILVSNDNIVWNVVTFIDSYGAGLPTVLQEHVDGGDNFNFMRARDVDMRGKYIKVRVLSGYNSYKWGLGEVEVFGSGATMETDDNWYNINADVAIGSLGGTVYYRAVIESDGKITYGANKLCVLPSDYRATAITGIVRSNLNGRATLEGRINAIGFPSEFWFEWGPTVDYGEITPTTYGGLQATPRHATASIGGLISGATYHYRVVASNEFGKNVGEDQSFIAK